MRAPRPGLTTALALLALPALLAPLPAAGQEVSFTYLGTGGWLLRYGDASILTAPFFSNPGLVEVGVARLEVDTAAVDRFLPPVGDVPAILVGHAHYDHLMDVPYIARVHAPRARVYGSRTMVNLLRGDPELEPGRFIPVEDQVGNHETPGEWLTTPDGRIRFMPLASEHAPHILGIRLFHGEQETPLARLPKRASEWLDGPTLAWLIDILDEEGDVVLRVHYQDSASRPPHGFPPPDGIPIDVMIVCTAGSGAAEGYPEVLVGTFQPRVVLLGHWEDFFRPMTAPVRSVPGTDLAAFEERLAEVLPEGAVQLRPNPGDTFQVPVRPTSPSP
ncbi:MAG: MBL fold metallo-hydrolase [Gemmatimonadales bacterium]|nr:MAG: MBL fold metallo-hydrolase [Gemmatimonadales bacterium]